MNFKKYFIALVLLIAPVLINAQQVSNVNSQLSGNTIIVDYTLTGAKFNQKFNVQLYVSLDGGKSFQGPMKAVSGTVGENIKSGNHKIYWDPYKDVNSLDGDIVFDVRAEIINQKVERHFFVHYTGSYSLRSSDYSAPLGLSIGQIGKVGWYVSARLNKAAFQNAEYDFNGTDVVNYDKVMYYEYDADYKYPSFEALAGITAQLSWNFFIYAGVGYGYQKYYWHMNEYDYLTNNIESDSYLNYTDYSASGFAAEAGFIVRVKTVSFNLGMSTLNFSYSNIVFGIGLNF
jgi:hypothetical protein